jgi:hypothetical protein
MGMRSDSSSTLTLGKLLARVTALVTGKLTGRSTRDALERLDALPRARATLEIATVLGGLFASALLAASAGVIGLLVYFVVILLVFR